MLWYVYQASEVEGTGILTGSREYSGDDVIYRVICYDLELLNYGLFWYTPKGNYIIKAGGEPRRVLPQ